MKRLASAYCSVPVGILLALNLTAGAAENKKRSGETISAPYQYQSVPDWTAFDSIYGRYTPGKGYLLSVRENVGLRLFRQQLLETLNAQRRAKGTSEISNYSILLTESLSPDEVLSGAASVMRALTSKAIARQKLPIRQRSTDERIFVAVPAAGAIVATLLGIDSMLDDLLNQVKSEVSSALFSLRSHVAATASDLNVMFKNRMDEAFDKLSAQEQKTLTAAQVLAANTQAALEKLEKDGYERSSDLICQTNAGFANFSLGLPIGRLLPPDLLCLKELDVRDAGPRHEQLLTFRGIHLLLNEEYPSAKITVAGQGIETTTGGGDSILQVPLPGGINGEPNDLSLRGDRIALVEFAWTKPARSRRWLFTLKPYLVRSLDATLTPTILGPVRKQKTQSCYVAAGGGSWGSNHEFADCTILADDGWEVESCLEGPSFVSNGDAGIRNRLFSAGACQWSLYATSEHHFGAGASYGFEGRAMLKKNTTMSGKPYESRVVINQGDMGTSFTYPTDYVPPEYTILQGLGDWTWQVDYFDNSGRHARLTDTQPSAPGIGVASMGNIVLTVTLQGPAL